MRWNTLRVTAAGFFGVIFLGALLLYLPISNREPIAFADAMFTSVTSVCVTGLVTITPATQFTLFGKVVLLILIQIGGLGVIACAALFFLLLRRRITLRERVVLQEAYGAQRLGGIVGMVKKVIIGTLAVEGGGAVLYAFQFVPEYGALRGIWYSVFHAVSAFLPILPDWLKFALSGKKSGKNSLSMPVSWRCRVHYWCVRYRPSHSILTSADILQYPGI